MNGYYGVYTPQGLVQLIQCEYSPPTGIWFYGRQGARTITLQSVFECFGVWAVQDMLMRLNHPCGKP